LNEIDRILRAETARIGGQLLADVRQDERGTYWQTVSLAGGQARLQDSPSLYDGAAGVALYLLELTRRTGDPAFAAPVPSALSRIRAEYERRPLHGFYAGSGGIVYLLLRAAEILDDRRYLQWADELARQLDHLALQYDDIMSGAAGTLLALLHLERLAPSAANRSAIAALVRALARRAYAGPEGFYWGRSYLQSRGLCGMAHGVAGIAFSLYEAARFFGNESCALLAAEGLRYENSQYREEAHNWPDFRTIVFNQLDTGEAMAYLEEQYRHGDAEAFVAAPDEMRAWCHGAPGIGLSRVRAFEVTNDSRYLREARLAAETTAATQHGIVKTGGTAVLCHGLLGNAWLFLEMARHDARWMEGAIEAARYAVLQREIMGRYLLATGGGEVLELENYGLMNGITGIGMFYLAVRDAREGTTATNLLAPAVVGRSDERLDLAESTVRELLIDRGFARTRARLAGLDPDYERRLPFQPYVESRLGELDDHRLQDVFALERTRVAIDGRIASHSLVVVKDRVNDERCRAMAQLDAGAFRLQRLFLDPDVTLYATHWDWTSSGGESSGAGDQPFHALLRVTMAGVEEGLVSSFAREVLAEFDGGGVVKDVVAAIVARHAEPGDDLQQLEMVILEQVRAAVAARLLLPEVLVRIVP
jgi:hypothetical protein